MAQIFAVNVYSLNRNQWNSSERMAFAPVNVKFRSVYGRLIVVGGVQMYGIVQENPIGLTVDSNQWYVAETVSQLVTLANA